MHAIKQAFRWLLWTLTGLVLISTLLGLWVYSDQKIQKELIVYLVQATSARTLTIDGDFHLDLSYPYLDLSLTRWSLSPSDRSMNHGSVDSSSVSLELPSLISGPLTVRYFALSGAEFNLHKSNDTEAGHNSISLPQINDLNLQEISLNWHDKSSGTTTSLHLDQATLTRISNRYELQVTGSQGQKSFLLSGSTQPDKDDLNTELVLKLPKLILKSEYAEDVTLHLKGKLAFPGNIFSLDNAQYAGDIKLSLSKLSSLPSLENLDVFTRYEGHNSKLKLDDINIDVSGKGAKMDIKGNINNADSLLAGDPLNIEGIQLNARILTDSSRPFADLLGRGLPELGEVNAHFSLHGTSQNLQIASAQLDILHPKGLKLKAMGNVSHLTFEDAIGYEGVNLTILGNAPDTASLESLVGTELPKLKKLDLHAHLTDSDGTLGLESLHLMVGGLDKPMLRITGQIDNVHKLKYVKLTGDELNLEGIQLHVYMQTESSRAFADLLGRGLPELGKVDAKFSLIGSKHNVHMKDARLEILHPNGLKLTANGHAVELTFNRKIGYKDVHFKIHGSAKNMGALESLVNTPLPDLDQLRLDAVLTDKDGTLGLEPLHIMAGHKNRPTLFIQGKIDNVHDLKQVRLAGEFEAESEKILETYWPDVPSSIGRVKGSLLMEDDDGSFGLEHLKLSTMDGARLSMQIDGAYDDIPKGDKIKLKVKASSNDMDLVNDLLGTHFNHPGSIDIEGLLSGNNESARVSGMLQSNASHAHLDMHASWHTGRLKLDGKVEVPLLRLSDIGINPTKETGIDTKPATRGPYIFDTTGFDLSALQSFDLKLAADIDQLEGDNLEIDKLTGKVQLLSGRLDVSELHAIYEKGEFKGGMHLDSEAKPPTLSMRLKGDDMDLNGILSHAPGISFMHGLMSLDVSLASEGKSPREVTSSLKGHIGLLLEQGYLDAPVIDYLAIDPLRWLFEVPHGKNRTPIDCGIVRFSVDQGAMSADAFYMQSAAGSLSGTGVIDLAQEKVDMKLATRSSKAPLAGHSSLSVKGPLYSPKISVDDTLPLAVTAVEIAEPEIFVVNELLGFLAGILDKGEKSPCMNKQ